VFTPQGSQVQSLPRPPFWFPVHPAGGPEIEIAQRSEGDEDLLDFPLSCQRKLASLFWPFMRFEQVHHDGIEVGRDALI
jgi:hypothetical protein